jgi:putative FmdB family regulatory protein
MPTYEYRCPTGHDFEKFYRKISDAGAEVPCPQCGEIGVRKLSAGAGLVFKGSGFYITDYGKDGKKDQPAAARSQSKGEGAAESSGGGDAATGAASDAKAPAESKPAPTESKPPPRESRKPDSAPASKPSKPSTE